MSREVCQHFIPIDELCEQCDSIYYGNLLGSLRGYKELVDEAVIFIESYKPESPAKSKWKDEWLSRTNKLKQIK
jgi:hypothetical protein